MPVDSQVPDFLVRLWELLTFWRYPPPAIPTMRLKPAGDDGDNALMMQFFTWEATHPEMSWWRHFETEVPTLAAMGITQVWLPPPNKAMRKQGQGYDAYDLWDLGEFYQKSTIPTRWGTKEELVRAVAAARAHGIDVLVDAVLNHKLGADRPEKFMATMVDPDNRLVDLGPPKEIEASRACCYESHSHANLILGLDRSQYSSMKWTHEHFTGLDWDHRTRTKGVYRITSDKHKGWSKWVDSENGNYDYLLGIDIDHRHPDVRQDLLEWGSWVLKTTGGAGFRFDAIKHMDRRFLLSFIKHVRQTLGRDDLFSVAEYWSSDLELIKPYIRVFEGLVTFFDVPLHYNFHNASKAGSAYDLRRLLDGSVLQFRPDDAVTFVDNHDTPPGSSDASQVGPNFKLQAYAVILLYGSGQPCVFYGDLYPNKEPECYDPDTAAGVKRLIAARRLFAYGARTDCLRAERNCVGFVRAGAPAPADGQGKRARPGCVVLISNADAPAVPEAAGATSGAAAEGEQKHTIRVSVGSANAGATYRAYAPVSSHDEMVRVDGDGWGAFTCPHGGLRVWVREEDLPEEPESA
ncbi:alpha amylase [Epithele typhae]|uniref:alpha amylase n=1 Tax=Epithele typhae TaxID=378194 RepID=UPI0020077A0A|nr:alpha amylase [Epithele typhae]KAH9945446.1 alpha amylase [Epithele typhae]